MHVEVEGENGFFPPIASNSYILHAIVSRRQGREKEEELAPFWYSPLPQSTYAKHIEKTTVSRRDAALCAAAAALGDHCGSGI